MPGAGDVRGIAVGAGDEGRGGWDAGTEVPSTFHSLTGVTVMPSGTFLAGGLREKARVDSSSAAASSA